MQPQECLCSVKILQMEFTVHGAGCKVSAVLIFYNWMPDLTHVDIQKVEIYTKSTKGAFLNFSVITGIA